jgi:hypothetical protein
VPVYIIGLGGPDRVLRGVTRLDLEAVTSKTGGKLYFASTTADLGRAYAEINGELRSQYLLTFYAARDLPPEARRSIEVDVRGRGLSARTVVGAEPED